MTDTRDVASLTRRLVPPMPSHGIRGWIGPLVVAFIGAILRLWNLGTPHAIAFDETYYPKDALSLLRFGYERAMVDGANETLLASDGNWRVLDIFKPEAAFVVHPPLGKWTIAVGQYFFGGTPFGWRIAVCVLGIIAIVITARIARRLTRSDLIGTLAGLFLALDGIHLVLSRTGLLDMILGFWVLVAFGLLLIDRDRTRRKMAEFVETNGIEAAATKYGPRFGYRPYRWAAAVALGLACAVKWSGIWFIVFSWTGWLLTDGGYDRNWAATQDPSIIPAALRSLWHYHVEAWNFHVNLTSAHSYASNPLSWPFQSRPTSFYWNSIKDGSQGCPTNNCAAEVLALGNPIIWWAAIGAMVHQVWRWTARRDWRAGAVLVGIAAGWLPWMLYLDRTIFTFYTVVYVPFVVMALAMTCGSILGPSNASERRRRWGAIAVGTLVLLVVLAAWWFYPIWTGQVIPYEQWNLRMWMPTWI